MDFSEFTEEDEAVASHAMAVIQEHVKPEKPMDTNIVWVSAMLNLCIAWLFHCIGEKRAVAVVNAALAANREHMNDPKPFTQ
jgi:hypothetical protein